MINLARRALPSLVSAGVIVELDRIIDVQTLAVPVLLLVIVCVWFVLAPGGKRA
jgi:hypothetical protein